jgi:hypothetical protein
MSSREKIVVQQLKLTPDQMQAATKRASESVKKMVVWRDPKAPAQKSQDKS